MTARRLRTIIALLLAGTLAAACGAGTGGSDSDEYEIYALFELTGPGGPTFVAAQNGARAAVAEINAAGGVEGRKLKLTVLDGQSLPDVTAAQARKAIGASPTAVITAQGSSNFAGAVPVLSISGIPVVSASIYDEGLLPKPQDWYYSIVATNPGQVKGLTGAADSLLDGIKGKRIAVITAQSAALDEIVDLLEEAEQEQGFELVGVEKTQLTFTTVAAQAAKIAATEPDAVMMLGYSPTTGPIVVNDLRDAGLSAPLITQYALSSDEILEQINDPEFYGMRVVDLPPDNAPVVETAQENGFGEGADSTFWTLGYQLVEVVKAGLEACGDDCSAEDLQDALSSVQLKATGAYGDYVFAKDDHAGLQSVQFYRRTASGEVEAGTDLITVTD